MASSQGLTPDGRPLVRVPRGALADKPAHGASCNRCGVCCMAVKCELARYLFGAELGPCPALERDEEDKVYRCGIVATVPDETLRAAAIHLIGAGDGCDARFNGEPVNASFAAYLDKLAITQRAITANARKLWGMS